VLAPVALGAVLDEGREVPEEWPTSASSRRLAARVDPGGFQVTHNGRDALAGAAAIVTALADAGTRVVFGLPGGGPNLDVVGAAAAAGLRFVLARTETAAVIMAATYADLTGRPGAAVVTRGPGLASAVNGLAHAALDRLPVVVIADTVRSADAGRISHQRLDQAALGRVVAKAVVTIGRDRTGEAAATAVRLALMPPTGPVVAMMDDSGTSDPGAGPGPGAAARAPDDRDPRDAAVLVRALRRSRRPVIMLGTGAIAHTAAIRSALAGRGIPALHTYRARGVVPDSAAEAAGLVTGGTMEWPLLAAADVIVGLGVDEAEMIPAAWDYPAPVLLVAGYPPGRRGSAYFPGATALDISLPAAIGALAGSDGEHDWPPDAGRIARTRAALGLSAAATARPGFLSPVRVVRVARSHVPRETVVTVDAGAHMLAVMPLWEVTEPRRLLISSGLATMGFALPAAIAAALSAPDRLVVAFTGDGGLGMTLAEIETAVRLRLRIAVVVFNDGALSLIKIKQRPAGQGGAEAVDLGPVSYARAAGAMGAAAATVSTEAELAAALSAAAGRDGPTVIDVQVDPAGYPAIMDLSRGEAGRQPVPGLPGPGPRPATVNVTAGTPATSAATVRSIQCRLPWRNSRMSPRAPSQVSSRSANARPYRA
jgi:acetolactate synthase I/II/III large subunit